MARKTVYLDEESEAIWDDLFGKGHGNASAWVKESLKMELIKNNDPFHLMKSISDLELQKNDIEHKLGWLKAQLEIAKSKREKQVNEAFEYNLAQAKIMGRTIMMIQPHISEKRAIEIAKDYQKYNSDKSTGEKLELPAFLQLKAQQEDLQ